MVKSLFIKCAKKFLHRPDLNFTEEIPLSYYLRVSFQRFAMLIRGFWKKLYIKKSGRRFFVGKKVKILCGKKMKVGNGVSIQDNVIINALSKEGVYLGDNVSIGMNTIIKVSGSLVEIGKGMSIGKNSTMGNDCFVGAAGGVKIGEYVAIGQNVRFHSENHEFSNPDKMICEQGTNHKGIKIGNDCWIGAGAVFLDGVEVGNGCVIGANTLVNKKIPEYAVAVGNPVRIIKYRK